MKKLLLLVLLGLLLAGASAEAVKEKSLNNYGVSSMVFESTEPSCEEISYVKDLNQNTAEHYTIFSVHAAFTPIASKGTDLNFYINDVLAGIAGAGEFREQWHRLMLPRELLKEKNTIKVCGKATASTPKIELFNDSLLGCYLMPDFSAENAFEKSISDFNPMIGEELTIRVVLRNYGSEKASVGINFRKPELEEEMDEIKVTEGQTTVSGQEIKACQERDEEKNCVVPGELVFEYKAKPTRAVHMTLLPAVLTYTNIFGETETLESNRLPIQVEEAEIQITGLMLPENENLKPGESTKIDFVVRNEGLYEVYEIKAKILGAGLDLTETEFELIESLEPNESKTFTVYASTATAGTYHLSCELEEFSGKKFSCPEVSIKFEEQGISPAIIAGLALVLLAIIAFALINKE